LLRFLDNCPEAQLAEVDTGEIVAEVVRGAFDGMTTDDLTRAMVLSARSRIERDPGYDSLAAQLQRSILYRQALGRTQFDPDFDQTYRDRFEHYIIEGIRAVLLTSELRRFDLDQITNALQPDRGGILRYPGVQTIYDRYLL